MNFRNLDGGFFIGFFIVGYLTLLIGYYVHGWYIHRKLRDKHYGFVDKHLKWQSIYLKALAETLAPEKLEELRKEENEKKENGFYN
jgi:hypothetical protein